MAQQPKWVVSRSLTSVGPNGRLLKDDLEEAIRELKATREGEIEVPARTWRKPDALGRIGEYRIYLQPVVLGHGKPYLAGPRPPLRMIANDRIGARLVYRQA